MLVKRSVTLSGHRTSIALEAEFWSALEVLAAGRAVPLIALIAQLDAERPATQPLTSCLRVAALTRR